MAAHIYCQGVSGALTVARSVQMRRGVAAVIALAATLGWAASCSSSSGVTVSPTAAAPVTITVASTSTTAPATTTSTSTTTAATTTTTLPPLPVPAPPPDEAGSPEPLIQLGMIEIPKLGLARPLFEGIRLSTLDEGPGHWPGTAMPGDVGNVVVAGHRVSHNRDFLHLDQLAPGDEVVMSSVLGRHVYHVTGSEIVRPDAMWIVDQTYERTATLFACHPPGSVSERIVVHLAAA